MKNLLRVIAILAAIWLLVGCGSDKGTSTPTPDTTQPDVTITIPDVEPTPDTTRPPTTRPRPRPTPNPITFPTPPIVVPTPSPSPPTTAPPTTAPPTTLAPVIRGVCGTEVNTCKSGRLVDLPDTLSSHSWACRGTSNFVTCTQHRPITVKGTGSIKLMAGGTHVGNASISSGYQDIPLTKTITNILCTSSDKARVRELFVGKIATDYWGTEDDEFCGAKKTALNGGTSKVTLSIGNPDPYEGLVFIHHKKLSGEVRKIHISIATTGTNKINLVRLILTFKKYITRSVGREGEYKYYNADGTEHETLNP